MLSTLFWTENFNVNFRDDRAEIVDVQICFDYVDWAYDDEAYATMQVSQLMNSKFSHVLKLTEIISKP